MLIKQSDIMGTMNEAVSFLENATYLTEEESVYHPAMIPVVENGRLGANLCWFKDLDTLIESNTDYTDISNIVKSICECNGIDSLKIAIRDYDLIENSNIINRLKDSGIDTVVIESNSDNSLIHIVLESIVDQYANTGNNSLLESIIDDSFLIESNIVQGNLPSTDLAFNAPSTDLRMKNITPSKHKKLKMAAGIAGAGVLVGGLYAYEKLVKEAESKPKTWIAKKIASLRSIYAKWMKKAQHERDAGKAGVIKKTALKLMEIIDKLGKKLQNAVN